MLGAVSSLLENAVDNGRQMLDTLGGWLRGAGDAWSSLSANLAALPPPAPAPAAPPPDPEPQPSGGPIDDSFAFGGGFIGGFIDGGVNMVTGTIDLGVAALNGAGYVVTHPLETAAAVVDTATHLDQAIPAAVDMGGQLVGGLWQGVQDAGDTLINGTWEERGRLFGGATFEVASAVVPITKIGKLGQLAKLGERVDERSSRPTRSTIPRGSAATRTSSRARRASRMGRRTSRRSSRAAAEGCSIGSAGSSGAAAARRRHRRDRTAGSDERGRRCGARRELHARRARGGLHARGPRGVRDAILPDQGRSLGELAQSLGRDPAEWRELASAQEVVDAAAAWGPGSKGIVFVKWKGSPDAHVFNVLNDQGDVLMLEGQVGRDLYTVEELSETAEDFTLLRTNNWDAGLVETPLELPWPSSSLEDATRFAAGHGEPRLIIGGEGTPGMFTVQGPEITGARDALTLGEVPADSFSEMWLQSTPFTHVADASSAELRSAYTGLRSGGEIVVTTGDLAPVEQVTAAFRATGFTNVTAEHTASGWLFHAIKP